MFREVKEGLELPHELIIKKSPLSGKGVFAKKKLKAGKVLGIYRGRYLSAKQFLAKRNTKYVYEIEMDDRFLYVDGNDPRYYNWTRYINGAKTTKQTSMVNVEAVFKGHIILIQTIDPIPAGRELVLHYGDSYYDWD